MEMMMMKRKSFWTIVLLGVSLVGLLVTPACKTGGGKADGRPAASKPDVPAYFAEIPADTPYVLAGTEPIPEDEVDDFINSLKNLLDTAGPQFDVEDTPSGPSEILQAMAVEAARAVADEGPAALGVDSSPYFGIWGLGTLPVVRVSLSDTEAFWGFVDDTESKLEVESIEEKIGGASVRRFFDDRDTEAVVLTRDDAAYLTIVPDDARTAMMRYLTGEKRPSSSLAASGAMSTLRETYGFEPATYGYVDIAGLVKTGLGVEQPEGVTKEVLGALGDIPEPASEVCREEITELTEVAPRLVVGSTDVQGDSFSSLIGVEMSDAAVDDLQAIQGRIPGVSNSMFGTSMASLGFGVDLESVKRLTEERAAELREDPYQCERLEPLNQGAERAGETQFIDPAWLAKLTGFALMIDSLEFGPSFQDVESIAAVGLIASPEVRTIFSQLRMFVPGLANLEVSDDGTPVYLERLSKQSDRLKSPHFALTPETLGASIGEKMASKLEDVMKSRHTESSESDSAAASNGDRALMAFRFHCKSIIDALPDNARNVAIQITGGEDGKGCQMSRKFTLRATERGLFLNIDSQETSRE
jgi:hypothetical protein